jgi:3-hydroxy-D-aspartate aldolase
VHREELATPALLLDLDAFEANVTKMSRYAKDHHRSLRPHGKTHKCPEVAKALVRAGAVGICAAKISEAEAFVENGVSDVLITTAVLGKHKIERAAQLAAGHPETIFCADNVQNVRDLNEAAGAGRVLFNVAIDLWVGRRTGIQPGEPALRLAQSIDSLPNLKFAGLQAYAGHASHVTGFENRRKVSQVAMAPAVETRRLLEASGIAVPLLSAGSTGTYNIDSEIDGITELQPGSFIFMDVDYRVIGGQDGPIYTDFRPSLSVLTTVVSKPANDVAVVDGGFKAFATDKPLSPECRNFEGLTFNWAGDEHGRVTMGGAPVPVKIGDHVEFTVPHCDPTVNLYDRIYCLRGERVETVWKIAARGMSQ